MTRLLLRDIPKAALGYDGFELEVPAGFRGLRGIAPGFHRVALTTHGRRVALHVVIPPHDAVFAFVLRGDSFEPAEGSLLDAAAVAGELDHALIDVSALPAAPLQAWQALTSRLARPDDAAAWPAIEPPRDLAAWTAWAAGDDAQVGQLIVGLQGAWLTMTAERDEAAADWLAELVRRCGDVAPAIVDRQPAVFAAVLDSLAAIRVVAADFARGVIDALQPLIAACATSTAPIARGAAARLLAV